MVSFTRLFIAAAIACSAINAIEARNLRASYGGMSPSSPSGDEDTKADDKKAPATASADGSEKSDTEEDCDEDKVKSSSYEDEELECSEEEELECDEDTDVKPTETNDNEQVKPDATTPYQPQVKPEKHQSC